ncbi:putative integral membrane protein [Anoxybacillus ayderensis]|uniref:Putative integral membrane protein n=1 Tax=Anoxybacillus ayderensis TaxID=265546 RepID=A0A0D0HQS4_9BACL|nr:YesL family protein [Anoxybacillus ayderensis]KIP21662.1 putative integral membrane protein [Anoxybacillus ayderensis]
MNFGTLEGKFYRFCEWITKLAYINVLWILFTLIGVLFLGFFPATVALFTIVRKWLLFHDHTFPIFKTFFKVYKQEFFKANALGLIFTTIFIVLYMDMLYLSNLSANIHTLFFIALSISFILYTVTLLYIFPVYVHYNLKFFQYLKYAFLIGMANPLITSMMVITIGLLCVVFFYLPGIIPFFSMSLFALLVMTGALHVFKKVERKQEKWGSSNSET